ncbi:MAG: hypothetical protein N3A57_01200 [Negativicutes bacterium]|nr:hypothetical protein [Negativicutes bacterium]
MSWEAGSDEIYTVQVEVVGEDRSGLLTDIMVIAAENKVNITSVNARADEQHNAVIYLNIHVNDLTRLESLMTKFRRIRDVFSVKRVSNQAS